MTMALPILPSDAVPAVPRVVVLMATRDGANWVGDQVSSILASRDVAVRIVVSDDGSRDRTLRAARLAGGEALSVMPGPGPGRGAAQNFLRLIREAPLDGADFVALADQDDLWRPDKLWRAIEVLGRSGAAAYSCDVTAVWPDGRRRRIWKSAPQRRWDYLFDYGSAGSTFVFPVATVQRLQALLAAAPSEVLAGIDSHDWLLYALARAEGLRWVIDGWSGVDYRQHGANLRGAPVGCRAIGARLRRLGNGWYCRQALAIGTLCDADCPVLDYLRAPSFRGLGPALRAAGACRRRSRDVAILRALLLGALVLRGRG